MPVLKTAATVVTVGYGSFVVEDADLPILLAIARRAIAVGLPETSGKTDYRALYEPKVGTTERLLSSVQLRDINEPGTAQAAIDAAPAQVAEAA